MTTVLQFISLLISGVYNVFMMFVHLPEILFASLTFVPTYLAGVLLVCLGIVILVRVLELLP